MGDIQSGKDTIWKSVRQSEMRSILVAVLSIWVVNFAQARSHLNSQNQRRERRELQLLSLFISFIRGRYLEGNSRKFSVVKNTEKRDL